MPVDNDKPTVIALREIADGLVDASILVAKPNIALETTEEGEEETEVQQEEQPSAET